MVNRHEIKEYFQQLQDNICNSLETFDGFGKFREDQWQHHGGGGGRTRLITGKHIEKGGVNFSAVSGKTSEALQKQLRLTEASDYFATGVSIVLHPQNPFVPIIHMNVRYFEMADGTHWFGGGIDLTPHFVFLEDGKYFHQTLKNVCDKFDGLYYPKFKDWADRYFYIPHRQENRGIGGIFFDYLKEGETIAYDNNSTVLPDKNSLFAFVRAVGDAFAPVYCEVAGRHINDSYTESDKQWQFVRRGRYAEFNLVWDRGTKFGLETGGRTESILMSLPPTAQWIYDFQPEKNTAAADSLRYFQPGIDWVS